MNWKRARTDDKKNERKEAIFHAAFTLFKQKGYDNVSFNGIANEAGFTKSNMYRYFSSKEEIFLNIFAELFEGWFTDCCEELHRLGENPSIADFSKSWVKVIKNHPQFMDLTPLLFIALEKNSSYEQLLEFKTLSKDLLFRLSTEISNVYPEFQGEKSFQFLNLSFATMSNSWAAKSQNDALLKIYQQEEFMMMKPNFEPDLIAALEIILKGLKASD
ncbi:TetR/AcrR family transcriptional regulator [Vibrio sp. ZSDE26]|uniref:TetR/AcrR family transcriptional regulator n=1 Tax=Vibrio amylolyticus TaxID=2847292 RepID=A0A9X1XGF9_9VIBR|nr:TetR family transcriptional regulator [Vibrio amylolyticus]MCK6261776.1 TetR/AcrR family transcriptional regulator [Vibrio amylolyticus]